MVEERKPVRLSLTKRPLNTDEDTRGKRDESERGKSTLMISFSDKNIKLIRVEGRSLILDLSWSLIERSEKWIEKNLTMRC